VALKLCRLQLACHSSCFRCLQARLTLPTPDRGVCKRIKAGSWAPPLLTPYPPIELNARRKTTMASLARQKENGPPKPAGGKALSSGELKNMLGQCLKLASENKITAANTWSMPLIEHLDDLIKEEDPTETTNFQRASVTLDAGVKIYSYRVDSVHTELFKMLGGLGRAAGPTEATVEEGNHCRVGKGMCLGPATLLKHCRHEPHDRGDNHDCYSANSCMQPAHASQSSPTHLPCLCRR
jgi:hypothetical protein